MTLGRRPGQHLQPLYYRPMFGSFGKATGATSINFVSAASLHNGAAETYNLAQRLVAVKGNRTVKKADMVLNHCQPATEIDAQTYQVRADGVLPTCDPAIELPMAQKCFLF